MKSEIPGNSGNLGSGAGGSGTSWSSCGGDGGSTGVVVPEVVTPVTIEPYLVCRLLNLLLFGSMCWATDTQIQFLSLRSDVEVMTSLSSV